MTQTPETRHFPLPTPSGRYVEIHVLRNFSPSSLNRDQLGLPKSIEFGQSPRNRISSQSLKRSLRVHFRKEHTVDPYYLAIRTRHIAEEIARRLEALGNPPELCTPVALAALSALGLGSGKDDQQSEYLLFLSEQEIDHLTGLAQRHWHELNKVAATPIEKADTSAGKKRAQQNVIPAAIKDALVHALGNGTAVDLALFGRMMADRPDLNVDAAAHVAHALSTHRAENEKDFFTAVDDLAGPGRPSSGMLGTQEIVAPTLYLYARLDVLQLVENLQGNTDLARDAVRAFLDGMVRATPSGKQASTAAYNPASFALGIVRHDQPVSLANAFLQPVRAGGTENLVERSIQQLLNYRERVNQVYGTDGVDHVSLLSIEATPLGEHGQYLAPSLRSFIESITYATLGHGTE